MQLTRFCGMIFLAVLFASPVQAEDWPTWRRDRLRSGVTGESLTLPLEQVWQYNARPSLIAPRAKHEPQFVSYPEETRYSLPVIAVGDAVYFTSGSEGRVVCLDAASGAQRWEFLTGGGVYRSPMYWHGRLYFGNREGTVFCLDAASGDTLWSFDAAPAERWFLSYGQLTSIWPVMTDVVVDGGVAYFAAGVFPHDGTFVYALNADTGDLIWRSAQISESGGRDSLAPGGHLFVTQDHVWVPKDFFGFSGIGYGAGIPFQRADGAFIDQWGGPDPEFVGKPEMFWPLMGVVHNGVRHMGNVAVQAEGERSEIWRHEIEGRMVDHESVLGWRAESALGEVIRYDPDLCSVVYAGGVVFHTAFDVDPARGGTGIYARDPANGEVLWTGEVPGRANDLLVANGRLIVSTREGRIFCFAPRGAEKHGVIEEPIEDTPLEVNSEISSAVEAILQATNLEHGYALVLDCQDGQLPFELARRSNLYICAVFHDAHAMQEARAAYVRAGLHLAQIVTYLAEPNAKLPFPSNFADLVVSDGVIRGGPLPSDIEEITRLTKPIRGMVLFSGNSSDDLASWIASTGQQGWETVEYAGAWARRVRPPLEEAGSWTHMYGDAGNTGCSDDGALKPPLGMVWYGPPFIRYGTDQTPLIVNGILVSPDANSLEAFDQYNGRKLWRLEAGGIGVGRGRLAASNEHIYVIWDKLVVRIDLESGEELGAYRTPFGEEHGWSWLGVDSDGKTIYGAGAGGVWATEMESGQGDIRWQVGGPDAEEQLSGMTAMSDGRIYILGEKAEEPMRTAAIAEMREWFQTQSEELRAEFDSQIEQRDIRVLTCLDCATGEILWRHGVDMSNCGGEWLRGQTYGGRRGYDPYMMSDIYVHNDVVVFGSMGGADKGWGVFNAGRYSARALTAYDAETGEHLWYQFANYRTRPVIVGDTIHAEPWAFDLRTGEQQLREHPITGEAQPWAWCRYNKQCGIFSASRYFLFGRSMGIGYQDLYSDQGVYTIWHSRASCWIDCVSGGGMMIKPPQALGCGCEWNLPFTIAMGQVSTPPTAAPEFAQPGSVLPVKHLHLDFAATGDRRDAEGNLWVRSQARRHNPLLLAYPASYVLYPGGGPLQRSAEFTPIEDAEAPFVFTTALQGLKRCRLPVTTAAEGAGNYRVRLGFAAPPGDVPGQRVFDVQLNGQTVLENFDIADEAGGCDRAVWREFQLPLEGDLQLDLVAAVENPVPAQLPLINGLEIFREETTRLGLWVPDDTWLGETKPGETVFVRVANHFDTRFSGRIEIDAPPGVELVSQAGQALELAPGEHAEIELRVSAEDGLAEGYHLATLQLVGARGNSLAETTMPVEYLGPLERAIVYGGARPVYDERYREFLLRNVWPNYQEYCQTLSQGALEPGDASTARSFFVFNTHDRYKERIRRARLRLYVSQSRAALEYVGLAADRERTPTTGDWGEIRQFLEPHEGNLNNLQYTDHPDLQAESALLAPVSWSDVVVEAEVPGDLSHVATGPPAYFLDLEPTSMGGVVYWGTNPPDPAQRPVLLIDYEPLPPN